MAYQDLPFLGIKGTKGIFDLINNPLKRFNAYIPEDTPRCQDCFSLDVKIDPEDNKLICLECALRNRFNFKPTRTYNKRCLKDTKEQSQQIQEENNKKKIEVKEKIKINSKNKQIKLHLVASIIIKSRNTGQPKNSLAKECGFLAPRCVRIVVLLTD